MGNFLCPPDKQRGLSNEGANRNDSKVPITQSNSATGSSIALRNGPKKMINDKTVTSNFSNPTIEESQESGDENTNRIPLGEIRGIQDEKTKPIYEIRAEIQKNLNRINKNGKPSMSQSEMINEREFEKKKKINLSQNAAEEEITVVNPNNIIKKKKEKEEEDKEFSEEDLITINQREFRRPNLEIAVEEPEPKLEMTEKIRKKPTKPRIDRYYQKSNKKHKNEKKVEE